LKFKYAEVKEMENVYEKFEKRPHKKIQKKKRRVLNGKKMEKKNNVGDGKVAKLKTRKKRTTE